MNAFAVLFNFIEKYADSQKHTLENTPLFLREREKFAMEYEIYGNEKIQSMNTVI